MRLSEGTVAIGLLAAFALWLFVGLPFYYLPLRDGIAAPIAATTASPNWAIALLGFFGGSMATWLVGRVHEYAMRPIVAVRLVEHRGCYVTTSRGSPPTHQARFLRLLIENEGRSPIKGCTGYITRITKTANNVVQDVQQEVLQLCWSASGGVTARGIPIETFFHMDVASLDLVPGPRILNLGVGWLPNHLAPLLLGTGTFELEIKVAAENARPLDRTVRFVFDLNRTISHLISTDTSNERNP